MAQRHGTVAHLLYTDCFLIFLSQQGHRWIHLWVETGTNNAEISPENLFSGQFSPVWWKQGQDSSEEYLEPSCLRALAADCVRFPIRTRDSSLLHLSCLLKLHFQS